MLNLLTPQMSPEPSLDTPSLCPKRFSGSRSNWTPLRQVVRMRSEFGPGPALRSLKQDIFTLKTT